MLDRILIPLNWLVGAIALLGAIFLPTVHEKLLSVERTTVENQASQIAQKQAEVMTLKNHFVQFPATGKGMREGLKQLQLNMDLANSNFRYETYLDQEGGLVVRAFTSPDKPVSLFTLVGIYTLQMDVAGVVRKKEWASLTTKKRGLF